MPPSNIKPEHVLDAIATGLGSIAPLAPAGPWKLAFSALAAAADFASSLFAQGLDGEKAITEMRSAMPDYLAAKARLHKLIDERAKKP